MAKVFGGGGSSLPSGSNGASSTLGRGGNFSSGSNRVTDNTKVFGRTSSPPCSDSGVSKIIPTSSEALRTDQIQSFSSSPNSYSKGQSVSGDINAKDFYNKSEIQKLLKIKADISSVYTKDETDDALTSLELRINQSLIDFITEAEVNAKVSASYDSILSYLSQNYYTNSQTYSKSQVDSLISSLSLEGDFLVNQPSTTASNTINPGVNNAIPLTLVASTNPSVTTIQNWVDNQSNLVGRIKTSGRVEFYRDMVIGQNTSLSSPALDVSSRRIASVADPINPSDAVNKNYVEGYIAEIIDNIVQGEDKSYIVDALVY